MQADKKDKSLSYFHNLQANDLKQATVTSMFSTASKQDDDGVRASNNISLLIARSGKPHAVGEDLIIPAIKEIFSTMLHKPVNDITKKLGLGKSTVPKIIDEMAIYIEDSLCDFLKTAQFSIQLDESTLPGNASLLMPYVRFVKGKTCHE